MSQLESGRSAASASSRPDGKDPRVFCFAEFEVDVARVELRRQGNVVPLHATPLRLLVYLLENAGKVVSKQAVLHSVWDDVKVSDAALSTALKEIRQALQDDGAQQRFIRTLRGRGYSFVEQVEVRVAARPRAAPRRRISGKLRGPSMYFVGRDPELEELERWLTEPGPLSVNVSIEGLAGLGKTELALQLVHRLTARGAFPGGIFWIDAETPDLTGIWGGPIADQHGVRDASIPERCRAMLAQLEESAERVLILLDNVVAWGRGAPAPLPQAPQISFLVTTRERNLGGARFRHFELEPLCAPHDKELVHRLSRRSFGAELDELLVHLSGHALAIELAAGFLGTYRTEKPEAFLDEIGFPRADVSAAPDDESAQNLGQMFNSLWERMNESTREVWWLASFFDTEPVAMINAADPGIAADGLRRLEELHLIRADANDLWTMHRLTKAFAQRVFPRSPRALDLLIAMGPHLVPAGCNLNELKRVYDRAVDIASHTHQYDRLFAGLAGLWQASRIQGDWVRSRAIAVRMAELAEVLSGSSYWMSAWNALGECAFYMGDMEGAHAELAKAVQHHESEQNATAVMQQGVSLFAYFGVTKCLRGELDDALVWMERSVQEALKLGGPIDLLIALQLTGTVHAWRGSSKEAFETTRRAVEICDANGLALPRLLAVRRLEKLAAESQHTRAPLENLERIYSETNALGMRISQTMTLGMLAESCLLQGERESGLEWVERGLRIAEDSKEQYCAAELWRIRAALIDDLSERFHCLRRALDIAQKQGAGWWRLRAAIDLASLPGTAAQQREARRELQQCMDAIRGGAELPDVRRAREILEAD